MDRAEIVKRLEVVNNNMVGGFVVRSIERNEQSNDVCHERVIASPTTKFFGSV